MANFGAILGNAARAYQGGIDGQREANADARTVATDAYDAQVREANSGLLPLRTQAAQLATQNQIDQAQTEAETAPDRRAAAKTMAKGAADLAPGQVDLAKKQQTRALDQEVFASVNDAVTGAKTTVQAQEDLLGLAGDLMTKGDMAGVNRVIEHAVHAPIFPGLNGLGNPVKSEVADAPAGSKDVGGQPIAGKALRVTFEDGSQKFINPTLLQNAYQKRVETARQSRIKEVKPGSSLVDTGTGKELYSNDTGYIDDGNGNMVKPGRGIGTGGGAGAGGGKVGAKDAVATALDTVLSKSSEKLSPDQVARAQVYAQQAVEQGAVSNPQEAALVATDAALHPEKITQKLNLQTGTWDDYYKDPKIAGGKSVIISTGTSNFADVAKSMRPEDLKANATKLLATMGTKAQQDELLRIASSTDLSTQFVNNAMEKGGQSLRDTTARKLEMIRLIAPKATDGAGPATAASKAGAGIERASVYAPDPKSRAGIAKDLRDRNTALAAAKDADQAKANADLSAQFAKDSKSLPPLEFVRKYDAMRTKLSTQDAQALKAAEKQIS